MYSTMVCPSVCKPRRRARGFSILEVMIATAVLGIAMIGLVKLHRASIRGMKSSRELSIAQQIATQVADEIATMDSTLLPTPQNPTPGGNANPCAVAFEGCRDGGAAARAFMPAKPAGCTHWFGNTGPTRRLDGSYRDAVETTEAGAVAANRPYRVDRIIRRHPLDTAQSTMVDVFVCWRDEGQIVRELHTRRVVGP
jgi:prepilin-type N-terminal cleavage/methylation domain-containing protein